MAENVTVSRKKRLYRWNAPELVVRYLETGDDSIRADAEAAAMAAAWDPAEAAAWDDRDDPWEQP